MISQMTIWKTVQATIDQIGTEKLTKTQACIGKGKIVTPESMDGAYVEDVEVAGTTLLNEKGPGQPMQPEDIIVGGIKRYLPHRMAKKILIEEDTLKANKYDKILQPSKRLVASAWKTQDWEVAAIIANCTSLTGGYDGVALASTSHVIPGSITTASNYLNSGSGMTPSQAAVQSARNLAALMPAPNGLTEGVKLTKLVFPDYQLDLWKTIIGTSKGLDTDAGNINTVANYGLKLVPVHWLDGLSTTFWAALTDADNGFRALEFSKIESRTWVQDDEMVACHGVTYSWALGWSNWRFLILGHT
jgi:hypothetical protein